jgi:pseudaminic acid synthase
MIRVGDRQIGAGYKPFIIAEMSGNHNGDLGRALSIVKAAAENGADAVKLQTYTADTMTMDISTGDFYIDDPKSLWFGRNLHSLYEEAHTPWEWHREIFDYAKSLGLLAFSTPFDATAVDFLEELDVPLYKIASFENTDLPLIRRVAQTGKPVIISVGLASIGEIDEAVTAARSAGAKDLVLLKTTSSYPATAENANIATIDHLRKAFNCEVGISDHTLGVGVALASVAFGATVIEKHLTLDRADGGVDSDFSMNPWELKTIVDEAPRVQASIGAVSYGPTNSEINSLKFRRSLYFSRSLEAGESLDASNVRAVRPGFGLPTKYLDTVLGMRVSGPVEAGDPVSWEILGKS